MRCCRAAPLAHIPWSEPNCCHQRGSFGNGLPDMLMLIRFRAALFWKAQQQNFCFWIRFVVRLSMHVCMQHACMLPLIHAHATFLSYAQVGVHLESGEVHMDSIPLQQPHKPRTFPCCLKVLRKPFKISGPAQAPNLSAQART